MGGGIVVGEEEGAHEGTLILHFTARRRRLGLGKVLGENADHVRAEVRLGELVLHDGTAGATSDREGEEKLDDARVAVLGSPAESVVALCGRVGATLQRKTEEKLDDVRMALPGSADEREVVG